MSITDALNGRTVEDVRRNPDGSVTLYCDSGNPLTLWVVKGRIEAKPPKIILPEQLLRLEEVTGERLNLREAFLGYKINYAVYDERGSVTFVCEPLRHNTEKWVKAHGHREVTLTHSNGLINELPPVSAVVKLPPLKVFNEQGQ